MLIDVIKSVTGRRSLGDGNIDHTVQMSEFLFGKFLEELNAYVGKSIFKNNPNTYEIKWMYWGTEWIIMHRAYRDDTNHRDVEEELYKQLTNK